jgi:hypothetical protein
MRTCSKEVVHFSTVVHHHRPTARHISSVTCHKSSRIPKSLNDVANKWTMLHLQGVARDETSDKIIDEVNQIMTITCCCESNQLT